MKKISSELYSNSTIIFMMKRTMVPLVITNPTLAHQYFVGMCLIVTEIWKVEWRR